MHRTISHVQGRLIPGSSVASLPFIDAVRGKAGGKDALPDEVFGRLRGALFLGPSWAVTRNKLKLRCGSRLHSSVCIAVPLCSHVP